MSTLSAFASSAFAMASSTTTDASSSYASRKFSSVCITLISMSCCLAMAL